MDQSRRKFLKTAGLLTAGIAGLTPQKAQAKSKHILSEDRMGVLVDTTVCIGCRKCEWACQKAHDLPAAPIETYEDRSVFEKVRRPDATALTVVNEYGNADAAENPLNVKFQCMHCDHPACASACIVGAITKTDEGAVIWDSGKCIGCRYCMVACPFQVPAFEYEKAFQPNILKCDFCIERTKQGKLPACVEICPMETLTYGRRKDLIELARKKIQREPDRYVDHIYGLNEVGGTSWLYLASKDFADVGFPRLGVDPAPGVSQSIQHGIFAYFVPPIALYALLGGVMWLTKNRKNEGEAH